MKLEVGMYVRTNRNIGKVTKIYERVDGNMVFDMGIYQYYFTEIKKASYKIVNLLKAGDYVLVEEETGFRKILYIADWEEDETSLRRTFYFAENNNGAPYYEEDIKSIVTKEQFESLVYKVEKEGE